MDTHCTRSAAVYLSGVLCLATAAAACSTQATKSSDLTHVRGTVSSVQAGVVTVTTTTGMVNVAMTPATHFATVAASSRADIPDGSFLGITSVTEPDGSQRAVEVHVFPESLRGTGEGSYDWDLPGAGDSRMTNGTAVPSRMTNGTVAHGDRASVTLEYHDGSADGSQTIAIPPGAPVVALSPAGEGDVEPGRHVFIVAHRGEQGRLTAERILVGINGVIPPM